MPIFRSDAEAVPHCVRVALSELLLSGVTTVADLSMAHPGWLDLLAESGLRVCVAPMFRSARWFTKNGHVVEYEWDEAAGEKAMARRSPSIERAEQHEIRPPVRHGRARADRHLHRHAAEGKLPGSRQARPDLADPRRAVGGGVPRDHPPHGKTPIGWLDSMGLLSDRSIIGHGIFLDDHPSTRWWTDTDMKRLAETGTTGRALPDRLRAPRHHHEAFRRYKRAGVNMGLGTDTYPHNMLDEMRLVAYLARTQADDPRSMTTTELFDAATTGGARALGREDIGHLAAGCRADFVLVDVTHPMMRPARDPVRSLVYAAGDRAVKDVYVDGRKVVADGEVTTMDYRAAAAHLHEAQKRITDRAPGQDWAHRPVEQVSPPTFRWS
jgi:cytosine/adenosine deaminase-related metal-dependent hydrolase